MVHDKPGSQRERLKPRKKLILGHEFIFDKIGLKLFIKEFSKGEYEIFIDENGYLSRRKKNFIENFHRWMKLKRTSLDIDPNEVHVHHKNRNVKDNRNRNLEFLTPSEHLEVHRMKKAYKTFCRKFYMDNPDADPQLCSWYWNRFKEKHDL